MKKLYFLFITFIMCSLSFGQTIYSENMGTPTATTAISANTFQNTTPITYSGTADVRTSTGSTGYTGASAGGNIYFTGTVGTSFLIEGINTSTYNTSELRLSFGQHKSANAASNELLVEVSTDGTTFTPLTYTRPSGSGTSNWTLISINSGIPSASNLRIRFTQTITTAQFRIDDVKVENFSASCTLTLGTTVTACSASTLSLDNYTVTIPYSGGGNATYTITTAGTRSGDNPSSIATGNIIVTFTEGTAYSITITGGTCNLSVSGNSPECKPINALPYYDSFNYTVGSSLGTLQTWTNVNSGDNITTTTGSLTYTGLTTAGNSVSFAADGIDCFSPITSTNSGTVYYSFLMNIGSMTGVTDTNGGYFAGIGENSTTLGATLWTKRVDDTNFNLGIEVRTATTTNTTYSTTSYQTGQTYFVVVGYTFNTATAADDVVSLWVNPTVNAAMPTATLTDSHAATDLLNASTFFLRQDSATETPTVQVDELRIGTAWADVVPQTAGINDNNINGLTMYPNPLSGNTLYLTSSANAAMSVQIFDLLGKEVLKANVVNNAVNVSGLNAGVYMVKVTEEGKTATRKLVIQ
jgi:hypothetical protein